jgi:hypothetical protein
MSLTVTDLTCEGVFRISAAGSELEALKSDFKRGA